MKIKPCIICGEPIAFGNLNYIDYERKQTCSRPCSHKLRVQRLYPNGCKPKTRAEQGAYSRSKKNEQLRLKEGKREKVTNYTWDEDAVDTTSPEYLKQLEIDMAWRESISCRASEVKVYTPEEIAAIANQITPINRIRTTPREAILFAEPDMTFVRRRYEESGTLFGRHK